MNKVLETFNFFKKHNIFTIIIYTLIIYQFNFYVSWVLECFLIYILLNKSLILDKKYWLLGLLTGYTFLKIYLLSTSIPFILIFMLIVNIYKRSNKLIISVYRKLKKNIYLLKLISTKIYDYKMFIKYAFVFWVMLLKRIFINSVIKFRDNFKTLYFWKTTIMSFIKRYSIILYRILVFHYHLNFCFDIFVDRRLLKLQIRFTVFQMLMHDDYPYRYLYNIYAFFKYRVIRKIVNNFCIVIEWVIIFFKKKFSYYKQRFKSIIPTTLFFILLFLVFVFVFVLFIVFFIRIASSVPAIFSYLLDCKFTLYFVKKENLCILNNYKSEYSYRTNVMCSMYKNYAHSSNFDFINFHYLNFLIERRLFCKSLLKATESYLNRTLQQYRSADKKERLRYNFVFDLNNSYEYRQLLKSYDFRIGEKYIGEIDEFYFKFFDVESLNRSICYFNRFSTENPFLKFFKKLFFFINFDYSYNFFYRRRIFMSKINLIYKEELNDKESFKAAYNLNRERGNKITEYYRNSKLFDELFGDKNITRDRFRIFRRIKYKLDDQFKYCYFKFKYSFFFKKLYIITKPTIKYYDIRYGMNHKLQFYLYVLEFYFNIYCNLLSNEIKFNLYVLEFYFNIYCNLLSNEIKFNLYTLELYLSICYDLLLNEIKLYICLYLDRTSLGYRGLHKWKRELLIELKNSIACNDALNEKIKDENLFFFELNKGAEISKLEVEALRVNNEEKQSQNSEENV